MAIIDYSPERLATLRTVWESEVDSNIVDIVDDVTTHTPDNLLIVRIHASRTEEAIASAAKYGYEPRACVQSVNDMREQYSESVTIVFEK